MSVNPTITTLDAADDGVVQCWCCDASDTPDRMVELGNHPEVHLCLRCSHFVHQQAWEIEDEGKIGPAAFARDRFRNLRAEVIRRGWHQNRFIGGQLRWLGRHLPYAAAALTATALTDTGIRATVTRTTGEP